MLDSYGRFVDDSRECIISQALDLVFKKDKEFARWLEQQADSEKHVERMGSRNGSATAIVEPGPQGQERGKRHRAEALLDGRRKSAKRWSRALFSGAWEGLSHEAKLRD
jgi:hypothetical protein